MEALVKAPESLVDRIKVRETARKLACAKKRGDLERVEPYR